MYNTTTISEACLVYTLYFHCYNCYIESKKYQDDFKYVPSINGILNLKTISPFSSSNSYFSFSMIIAVVLLLLLLLLLLLESFLSLSYLRKKREGERIRIEVLQYSAVRPSCIKARCVCGYKTHTGNSTHTQSSDRCWVGTRHREHPFLNEPPSSYLILLLVPAMYILSNLLMP